MPKPRYPIYVPTKARADRPLTAKLFASEHIDFRLVVEPQEVEAYFEWKDYLLVLPENNRGLVFARNWIRDHSVAQGAERHWQFDDDIQGMQRFQAARRVKCPVGTAMAAAEDFVDRYENVGLASFNSTFFNTVLSNGTYSKRSMTHFPPFYLNARCYTDFLMLNSLPNRWRYRYNEDTDMTLQVLASGWCTVLFNSFLISTPATLTQPGGQMQHMYGGDGRLKMARELERVWPGVVKTGRRFNRPQHQVKGHWQLFDTPLKLKSGVELPTEPNEYGLQLVAKKEVRDAKLRKWYEDHK